MMSPSDADHLESLLSLDQQRVKPQIYREQSFTKSLGIVLLVIGKLLLRKYFD